MEERMNREIRGYQEKLAGVFSLREFLFCMAGIICGAAVYLACLKPLGSQMASWLCMLAAAPFVVAGFLNWHGMTVGRAARAILRDVLTPQQLGWHSVNYMQRRYLQPKWQQDKPERRQNI